MTPPTPAAALAAALRYDTWGDCPILNVEGTVAALAASGWQLTRDEGELRAALEALVEVLDNESGEWMGPAHVAVQYRAALEQARAALAASGWQLVKDEPSAVGVTRRDEGLAVKALRAIVENPKQARTIATSTLYAIGARAALANGEGGE